MRLKKELSREVNRFLVINYNDSKSYNFQIYENDEKNGYFVVIKLFSKRGSLAATLYKDFSTKEEAIKKVNYWKENI